MSMTTPSPMELLNRQFEAQANEIELLKESIASKMIALEDIGWTQINGNSPNDEGPTLQSLHTVTPKLRDMAAVHPLHIRGAQLRHAYVFGRGVEFANLEQRTQTAVNNLYNQAVLFSVQAHETNNLELFCAGNLIVVRNEATNVCMTVPIEQIKAEITDPDDSSSIRYILREWTSSSGGESTLKQRWYPLARYKKSQVGRGKRGKINKTISYDSKRVEVAQDSVAYLMTTKRQAGWCYGVPDSLGAAVHSINYSEYIADNSKLVKALQQIAWSITTASKKANTNAGVSIAQPGVGGTAVMGTGNAISSVGVPSAQVDFNKGQPIAALVAATFGVPVIALLSSPGATGGSYGSAQTLDFPTIRGMRAIQDSWKLFYQEILRDMGSPDVEVRFPNIESDPAYRQLQSLATAYAAGLFHQSESREKAADILDVRLLETDLPEPNPNFKAPAQGVTGTVPGGTDQDITNHDGDGEDN